MKVAFYTLGCKVNQYESEEMRELLSKNGYSVVPHGEDADIYIINSCTVTQESTRKSRQSLRKFKSLHPGAVTVFTGCVPSAFPDEAENLGADIVISNKNNSNLPELLDEYFSNNEKINRTESHERGEKYVGDGVCDFDEHTRCFVKIQDGCDRYCSYCAIPYAKGPSRSKSPDIIEKELTTLGEGGYKEVVLIGINLTSYGKDIGLNICDAIETAQKIDKIKRIRLGSLEPDHITPEVIERMKKCDKLMPQFHLSLQSGSNTVLKRMNRHYTAEEYLDLTQRLRTEFQDAAITTDIITGFPGETEEEFGETLDLVKKVGFEKVHAFPFSKRDGTPAAKMENQITNQVKSDRARELIRVADEIRQKRFHEFVGKSFSVLFERPKDGFQTGYSENYSPVKIITTRNLTGEIRAVKIIGVEDEYLLGELE